VISIYIRSIVRSGDHSKPHHLFLLLPVTVAVSSRQSAINIPTWIDLLQPQEWQAAG